MLGRLARRYGDVCYVLRQRYLCTFLLAGAYADTNQLDTNGDTDKKPNANTNDLAPND